MWPLCAGHVIECGWILLEVAKRKKDETLKETAIENFILNPMKRGWDQKYGGLFYFLDANDLSPTQLEWNMKLWWAHNEAMIAHLMAYQETGTAQHLDNFAKVFDYSYKHVCCWKEKYLFASEVQESISVCNYATI